MAGTGPEIVGVEFVEAGTAQAQNQGGSRCRGLVGAEVGQNGPNQRGAKSMDKLPVAFFIVRRVSTGRNRLELRPLPCGPFVGLRYAAASFRPAGQPSPGLIAHLSGFARTASGFDRTAAELVGWRSKATSTPRRPLRSWPQ